MKDDLKIFDMILRCLNIIWNIHSDNYSQQSLKMPTGKRKQNAFCAIPSAALTLVWYWWKVRSAQDVKFHLSKAVLDPQNFHFTMHKNKQVQHLYKLTFFEIMLYFGPPSNSYFGFVWQTNNFWRTTVSILSIIFSDIDFFQNAYVHF